MNHVKISDISKHFPKKHSSFILECYDYLRDIVPFDDEKVFVSGGFFPRRFIGAPLRDIDVYVGKNHLEEAIEEYRRLGWITKVENRKTYDGEEAGTKRDLHHICKKDGEPRIDLISFHQPQSVYHIEKFDLDIVQLAMTEDYIHFVNDDIFERLENKNMRFTGNICMRTFERIIKYTKIGYTMDEDILKQVRNAFVEQIEHQQREKNKKQNEEIPF